MKRDKWLSGYLWGSFVTLLVAGALLLLSGCASVQTTGLVTAEFAGDSGYDQGIGLRVETVRDHGVIRPRADAKIAWQPKANADTGYTYSGLLGLQVHGCVAFVEAGGIAYGYRSTFPDRTKWGTDQTTGYLRAGAEWPALLLAVSYYPPTDDSYDSDELKLEARWLLGERWAIVAEPSVYRLDVQGRAETGSSFSVGFGRKW